MSLAIVWLAALDCALFTAAWAGTRLLPHVGPPAVLGAVYWGSAFLGLLLGIYGFLVVTLGGPKQLRKAVVCVLFAMAPGCAGLVALLWRFGGHPV